MPSGSSERQPEPIRRASILDRAETLTGALESLVHEAGHELGLTILFADGHEEHTALTEIWSGAGAYQARLREAGFEPGRVVVIALHTGLDLVHAYFGALLAGGVPALVAPPSNRVADLALYERRIDGILANARAGAVVCSALVANALAGSGRIETNRTLLLTPGGASPSRPDEVHRPGAADVATVQYSSGSTGSPKGILLTHRAILENMRSWVDRLGLGPGDVSVNWLPLYHDMGLICSFLMPLFHGYSGVMIPTMDFARRPELWLAGIGRHRGTVTFSPNFGYSLCAKRIPETALAGLDLSCWRLAVTAAEPILASTCRAFRARFEPCGLRPTALTAAYGMAEYVTVASADAPEDELFVDRVDRQSVGTDRVARPAMVPAVGAADGTASRDVVEFVGVGRAVRATEICVRGADGRTLADREIGEICVRGSSLFAGYRDDPELTAASRIDGWFRSGDLGYRVGERLFFVTRAKDLIVIAGENHAPQDIEALANPIDGVRDGCVAAFGVSSEAHGTEELAVVAETKVSDPEQQDRIRAEIRRAVMAGAGLGVRHLLLVPPGGVEKTTSGKLARRATRLRYESRFADPLAGEPGY